MYDNRYFKLFGGDIFKQIRAIFIGLQNRIIIKSLEKYITIM